MCFGVYMSAFGCMVALEEEKKPEILKMNLSSRQMICDVFLINDSYFL